MPIIARIKVSGEVTVYHVMSRTASDGFVIGDVEKDFLLRPVKRLSGLYFAEAKHYRSNRWLERCEPYSPLYVSHTPFSVPIL